MYNSNRRGQASTVAHNWAHENQSSFKKDTVAGSLYYEGKVIYSYGAHFPIAVIGKPGYVLFTTRSYRNTTAKHISAVRSACTHKELIWCNDPKEALNGTHSYNLKAFDSAAKDQAMKLPKSKKPEIYLSAIAHQLDLYTKYCEYFGLEPIKTAKKYSLQYLFIKSKDGGIEATQAETKAIEKANKKRQKELEARQKKEVADFRTFETDRVYVTKGNDAYLRYNEASQRIETSKGIQIPVKIAKAFYSWLNACIRAGGCAGNCDRKILNYQVSYVNDKEFTIGCHTILMSEAVNIAKLLNW